MNADPTHREIPVSGPYDMVRTLGRQGLLPGDPTSRRRTNVVWRGTRTPDGVAGVVYEQTVQSVRVTAWGPGADWVLEAAPDLLGLHDDPLSFAPEHPLLKELHRAKPGIRFGRTGLVMERLVPVIVGQKVTSKGAGMSWRELVFRFGERAPGPGEIWVGPDPAVLAHTPNHRFVQCNIEGRRAAVIKEVCFRRSRMEEAAQMGARAAMQRLQAMAGIGPWTATLTVSATHGDPDLPWIGDYHLPNTVAWMLAGEPRGDDERMLELLEPFRPHRGRALWLLKMSGQKAPKYGPRSEVRNIRDF